MTLSIGFLAPRRSELIGNFIDESISGTALDTRFADPERLLQKHAGEINRTDLDRIRDMMRSSLMDDALLQEWFGRYITRGHGFPGPKKNKALRADGFMKKFRARKSLHRGNGVRSAYIRQKDRLLLFLNGESFPLGKHYLEFAVMITEQAEIHYHDLKQHASFSAYCKLLRELHNLGIYYFP